MIGARVARPSPNEGIRAYAEPTREPTPRTPPIDPGAPKIAPPSTQPDSTSDSTGIDAALGRPARDAVKGVAAGVLMGLANLVPGISGGTMLVAAGIYPRFIRAVSEITRMQFRPASLLLLGAVTAGAMGAIFILAGDVVWAVTEHRWVMYSLFIGLTLGGLPLLKRMVGPLSSRVVSGAVVGFLVMAALTFAQSGSDSGASSGESTALLLVLAGVMGASAMILPGVSGAYLLLVLGQYVPILASIDRLKIAINGADVSAVLAESGTLVPVGIGVLIGIVGVSNILRLCLDRVEKPTLGVLMGLLLGSVMGLWPWQQAIDPVLGETIIKGVLVTQENLAEFDRTDFPVEYYRPEKWQPIASLGLAACGFFLTLLIARFGGGSGGSGNGGGEPATDAVAAAADNEEK